MNRALKKVKQFLMFGWIENVFLINTSKKFQFLT